MGRRGARARPRGGQAAARLDRLLRLPLVPRDGARVLRGRRDGCGHERAVRVREGRPGGTPRRRRDLHGRAAGDDGLRRLAAERLPRPRRGPVLRRHLLPAAAAPGHAELEAGAPGRRPGLARAARGDRPGRADDPAAPAWSGGARGAGRRRRPGIARLGADRAEARLRPRARRLGQRAQVPADVRDRVPAAPRGARDGAAHAAPDGGRRHLRPDRRRLLPLQRRRAVDRPPLREDALRQRAAGPRVPARLPGVERAALRARVYRDARLGAARASPGGGRLRLGAGRRLRGRRGQVLRLDARGGARRAARRAGRDRDRALRHDRERQLRGREHPGPRHHRPRGAGRDQGAPAGGPRAAASGRASTTSA